MKRVLGLLTVLAIAFGACGSDGGDEDTEDTTTTTAEASPRAGDSELAGKLLTESDMPAGYTKGELTEEDGVIGGDEDDPLCPQLTQAQNANPPIREAQIDFSSPGSEGSPDGAYVASFVSRYESAEKASAALAAAKTAFASCATVNASDAETTTSGTTAALPFSSPAEEELAVKMDLSQTTEGVAKNLDIDFILQRKGKFLSVLSVLVTGDAQFEGDMQTLAAKSLAKL